MKPALFGGATRIRPEYRFEGERFGSCERVLAD